MAVAQIERLSLPAGRFRVSGLGFRPAATCRKVRGFWPWLLSVINAAPTPESPNAHKASLRHGQRHPLGAWLCRPVPCRALEVHHGPATWLLTGRSMSLFIKIGWAFFWLALRTLTFLGFYMNYNKEAKSLNFRRGSEVSQVQSIANAQTAQS